jgi:tyrosyl-tRNA synthetase
VLLHETMPQGIHPMEAKKSLARRITARFHSAEKAKEALEEFERRFSRKDLEHSELPRFTPAVAGRDLLSVVVQAYETCFGITKSRSDARRLIEGGSVQFGGEKVVDPKVILPAGPGILKLDKTRAVRI